MRGGSGASRAARPRENSRIGRSTRRRTTRSRTTCSRSWPNEEQRRCRETRRRSPGSSKACRRCSAITSSLDSRKRRRTSPGPQMTCVISGRCAPPSPMPTLSSPRCHGQRARSGAGQALRHDSSRRCREPHSASRLGRRAGDVGSVILPPNGASSFHSKLRARRRRLDLRARPPHARLREGHRRHNGDFVRDAFDRVRSALEGRPRREIEAEISRRSSSSA
jgi:hypothetical protein